jgi:hypothetical protein
VYCPVVKCFVAYLCRSDLEVSARCLETGVQGAIHNVDTNLAALKASNPPICPPVSGYRSTSVYVYVYICESAGRYPDTDIDMYVYVHL